MKIYRLELAYFNPAENRWQLFQEYFDEANNNKQDEFELLFCSMAQNLLKSLRKSIEDKNQKTKAVQVLNLNNENDQQNHLCIEGKSIMAKLQEAARKRKRIGDNASLANLLDEIKKKHQKIAKSQKKQKKLFDRLFEAIQKKENVCFDRKEVTQLLSGLFIAPHWDVFGRISFPPTTPTPYSISGASMREMDVEIEYIMNMSSVPLAVNKPDFDRVEKEIGPLKGKKRQIDKIHKVLGYSVRLKLAYPQKSNAAIQDVSLPYFQFCHAPDGNELIWYTFYAYLFDLFQRYLLPVPEPDNKVNLKVLPLRICGYDHFIHIYYSEEKTDLWEGNQYVIIKECVRELLVQMHISAFQYYSELDLKQKRVFDSIALRKIFCKNAPTLVRMDYAKHPEGQGNRKGNKEFRYREKEGAGFKEWELGTANAEPPKDQEDSPHIARIDNPPITMYIPWEDDNRYLSLEDFFKTTGEQRLREQWIWLQRRAVLANLVQSLKKIKQS